MIAYLKGVLAEKQPNKIILEVGGVGYAIGISVQTYDALPNTGVDLKLFIHHHFTESDQNLYGFYTKDEQNLFESLITVKSIGPKLGLTILSGLNPSDLSQAIMQQDIMRLSKIPGIGKKTAERMVLELKDKIGASESQSASRIADAGDIRTEAVFALESLGYRRTDAEKAVLKVFTSLTPADKNVSGLVKAALKSLN